ncbi:lysophospholipase [Epithele typhae]|uniref:lysophospholipase n=1 Tax=Epithele typhae TaxID=378194 RepID=UPI00200808FF|nr:lysophospholipase [Epithele typhae]KAH9909432.1 lysophospholipase [Epithele typhae]
MDTASTSTPDAFTEAWLPGPDGTSFYTRTYASAPCPARAAVVFVHGFSGHCARYEWMHGEYAARGVTVFTFDQRGFGRTALDAEERARTPGALYGRTSWREQLGDIEWWVRHVKDRYPGLPVFLMGHSMGGGLALAFATRPGAPPKQETLALLSGIIAGSPLVQQSTPTAKPLRVVGGLASGVLPWTLIATPLIADDLSHDTAENQKYVADPMVIQKGTLRGVNDMLSGGDHLLAKDYKSWPKNMPLLILHGSADRITSPKASRDFFDKVEAEDKEYKVFDGGYHEVMREPNGMKEEYAEASTGWMLERAQNSGSRPVGDGSKL